MRIVVTHMRPDLDAVGSVWSIKRFLPNWEDAEIEFVPAGERWGAEVANENSLVSNLRAKKRKPVKKGIVALAKSADSENFVASPRQHVIEKIGSDEVIHVDTGLGPLDHHQTSDEETCAAKRAWEWVINQRRERADRPEVIAGDRLMDMVCQIDHFKEVFWPDPVSDRYDITAARILDGVKLIEKDDDRKVLEFGLICFDSLFRAFQNKVWAEQELAEKGIEFKTKWGKGIGVETFNDDVIHLSQRMGYKVAVRKDPKKGYVRIKARPDKEGENTIDLTPAYKELLKKDSEATWFLHVSKRMLLNGTTKNPLMKPTKLTLEEIIEVLKKI